MEDAAGELHAAVTPHEHRRRDLETASRAAVGQGNVAAIDVHRRRRQPWQQHLARCCIYVDRAAENLPRARQFELGVAPHRQIEALEHSELWQCAREGTGDDPLHRHRKL
jgi:hypothetical protein